MYKIIILMYYKYTTLKTITWNYNSLSFPACCEWLTVRVTVNYHKQDQGQFQVYPQIWEQMDWVVIQTIH